MKLWARNQIFHFIHGNNLVYNQCWEDPRLDREAFRIRSSDNLVLITSAGCNALDYLLDNPNSIDAVDLNPRQNALLELKVAGIKSLEHEDFFALFGTGLCPQVQDLYNSRLRAELPGFARDYWDRHIDFFQPSRLNRGFYFRGSAGWVARLFNHYISLKGLAPSIDKAFGAKSLSDQANIYFTELKPYFWNEALRWLSRRGAMMSALGVPRSQFIQIENEYRGGMAKFIEDCLDYVFSCLKLQDNYFWHLYLFGYYSPQCAPEYLKKENFSILRERVHRLKTHSCSLLDFFSKTDKTLHKVTLLDHMDWLYQGHKDLLQKQWQQLINKSEKETKILWRSASLKVDFIDSINLTCGKTLGQILQYDTKLAAELHARDRVHTYGSFYIAGVR